MRPIKINVTPRELETLCDWLAAPLRSETKPCDETRAGLVSAWKRDRRGYIADKMKQGHSRRTATSYRDQLDLEASLLERLLAARGSD